MSTTTTTNTTTITPTSGASQKRHVPVYQHSPYGFQPIASAYTCTAAAAAADSVTRHQCHSHSTALSMTPPRFSPIEEDHHDDHPEDDMMGCTRSSVSSGCGSECTPPPNHHHGRRPQLSTLRCPAPFDVTSSPTTPSHNQRKGAQQQQGRVVLSPTTPITVGGKIITGVVSPLLGAAAAPHTAAISNASFASSLTSAGSDGSNNGASPPRYQTTFQAHHRTLAKVPGVQYVKYPASGSKELQRPASWPTVCTIDGDSANTYRAFIGQTKFGTTTPELLSWLIRTLDKKNHATPNTAGNLKPLFVADHPAAGCFVAHFATEFERNAAVDTLNKRVLFDVNGIWFLETPAAPQLESSVHTDGLQAQVAMETALKCKASVHKHKLPRSMVVAEPYYAKSL